MTPVEALERVVHCLDRAHDTGFKAKAFVRALEVVRSLPEHEVRTRSAAGTLTELDGIGPSSAKVVHEAIAAEADGSAMPYLAALEASTQVPLSADGAVYRRALKGDLHLHSRWSDGGAPIERMVRTAIELGHEYVVITDHSPRLTVAHGLDAVRLAGQLEEIESLRRQVAPFRILTGIEVDILEDGSLDHPDDVLAGLDLVIASVHSKLRMPPAQMTERMLRAVEHPHVDVLGHCTGRLIGSRPPSEFDADAVFTACAGSGTAVEINCRPERLDPPADLLVRAVALGCWFSIDSDAHSTGQLEWQPLGCDRAAAAGVPLHRVINTLSADDLLAWTVRPLGPDGTRR
jgi:putative hydrolase